MLLAWLAASRNEGRGWRCMWQAQLSGRLGAKPLFPIALFMELQLRWKTSLNTKY